MPRSSRSGASLSGSDVRMACLYGGSCGRNPYANRSRASRPTPGHTTAVKKSGNIDHGRRSAPTRLPRQPPAEAPAEPGGAGYSLTTPLHEVERRHILRVLEAHAGNKVRTAKVLGINVKTLYNKLKSYEKTAAGSRE